MNRDVINLIAAALTPLGSGWMLLLLAATTTGVDRRNGHPVHRRRVLDDRV
jgi:hypothetical protein